MIDMRSWRLAMLALLLTAPLSGCAGALLGAGATAGVAAYSERGIEGTATDTVTATKIHGKLLDNSFDLARRIDVTVYDGRVLLTGAVPNEHMRADAVRAAWSVPEVKDVLNEVQIADPSLIDDARDSLITSEMYAALTGDSKVMAINYSIETVNSVIYLIGTAQSQDELDRVINHARNIAHVRKVVNFVTVKPKAQPAPTSADKGASG